MTFICDPSPAAKEVWNRMANPFEFLQQVRAEASKVTWPTRRETMVSTALVILMVIIASIFFVSVDWSIKHLLGFVLTLGK